MINWSVGLAIGWQLVGLVDWLSRVDRRMVTANGLGLAFIVRLPDRSCNENYVNDGYF